jgi:hypothetical protein
MRLVDVGVKSRDHVARLAAALHAASDGKRLRLINEPEGSVMHDFLLSNGFTRALSQYEMHMQLA